MFNNILLKIMPFMR